MSAMGTVTIDLNKVVEKHQAEARKLRDQCDELVAKVEAEDRDYTKDEQESLKAWQDTIVALNRRTDTIKRQAEVRGTLDAAGQARTVPPNKVGGENEGDERAERQKRYKSAFNTWLRRGFSELSNEERDVLRTGHASLPTDDPAVRAMSAITGASGGFTVPTGFVNTVEKAMKDFSGVLQSPVSVLNTATGVDLPWPTVNDTSNEGEQVEENVEQTNTDVTGFGQITMKAYLFSSKLILVPHQLTEDSQVDIEGLIADLAAERLGRITNKRWTTGTGANQPQGIVTGSTLGKTAASATAVTYAELVDLQVSIDPAYNVRASWEFNNVTFGALRKLVDSDGRPIWMPAANSGMAGGAPGLLLDKPYAINQHMADMASGAKSIIYGDHSKYKIRRVSSLIAVRLTERYAEKLQTGFFVFMRCDGRLINAGTNPIKHLLHP